MEISWEELKERLYFEDGTLRDIYVFGVTRGDWADWVDIVNANYEVAFAVGDEAPRPRIDFEAVKDYWTGRSENSLLATVKLGKVLVNCHFFTPDDFESDLDPREFTGPEDHARLVEYLQQLAAIFDRKVLLSEEDAPEFGLLEVTPFGAVELIDDREIDADDEADG